MIKTNVIQFMKQLTTNRYLFTLSSVLAVLSIALVIYILFNVHPSELQLVTHYTAFGVTHLYRDQWFYLLSFAAFALITAFLHIAVALKVYLIKGHPLAITIAWVGIGVIGFAWVVAISIVNVWSPVS